MNAIQNPPMIFRISDNTEEWRASRIFPRTKVDARIIKTNMYQTLKFRNARIELYPLMYM
jgi:hypothetical protein